MRVDIPFVVVLVTLLVSLDQTSSATICDTPKIIHLTAPHGIVQTPNFPHRFQTPLCIHWIIDSQSPYTVFNEPITVDNVTSYRYSNGKRIRVYLTQVFLKENVTFVDYIKYPYPNGQVTENELNSVRRNTDIVESGYSRIPHPRYIKTDTDLSVIVYATELRFFGIQVELMNPYPVHFRARNFLHTYGFNITYDIVDERQHREDFRNRDSCTLSNCSFAGNCYLSHDYRRFSCSCYPGRYGEFCEYHDLCSPERNITFCRNGGTCKMQATGVGTCFCPPGFTGQLCGVKLQENSVKVCPGAACEDVCDRNSESIQPCSCHTGRNFPKGSGWMRYEVMLQAGLDSLPNLDFRLATHSIPPLDMKLKAEIEFSIGKRLESVPGLKGVNTSVAIVAFGPASKIFFQFFGPNETMKNEQLIKEVLISGPLSPLRELSDTFKFSSYPALALTSLFRGGPNQPLKVGETFDLHCEAEGSHSVTFKWFKEGIPINRDLATREFNAQPYQFQKSFVSKSILMFTASTVEDRGIFTCQVSDMGEEQCRDISIAVVAPPYVALEPMSLTIDKGEHDVVLLCYSENESSKYNFTYNWAKNGSRIQNRGHWTNEIIEDLHPYGSLLRILTADSSAKYSCVVRNCAGENESAVDVTVLETQYLTFCRHELDEYNLSWNRTAVGQVAKRSCPTGFGFVQRNCDNSSNRLPKWGRSNFSKCVSKELRDLSKQMQILRMGFANKRQIFELTERLVNHLGRKTFLFTGEGETIIGVLEDIGNYAIQKKDVIDKSDDKFLRSFMNATTQFLRFPASCILQSSVVTIGNLIRKVATKFPTMRNPFIWDSEIFVLEKLQISTTPFSHPIRFPMTRIPWANFILQIPSGAKGSNESLANDGALLLFIVFRNLTSIAYPKLRTSFAGILQPYQVESPIISITTPNYTITHSSNLHLTFNISSTLVSQIQNHQRNYTCGGMEYIQKEEQIPWTINACAVNEILSERTVECVCEHFGQFGLLVFDREMMTAVPAGLVIHWSIILGTVVLILGCGATIICILIHIEFQFSSDSLYSLKLIVCSTLIFSHLFILSLRSEAYSIPLSTALCSLLVLSLSCQLTTPLIVLVSEQIELFSWLRSVSNLTLAFGFFVVFSIPIWAAAVALSHWRAQAYQPYPPVEYKYGPVLSQESTLFGIFVVMVCLMVTGFLIFYFKAFSRLRMLRLGISSGKPHFVDYRQNVINGALIVTTATVMTMIAGILHVNIPYSEIYQYFFGLATISTGIAVFLAYTVKSEHPIPQRLVHCLSANPYQDVTDPEKILTHRSPGGEARSIHSRTPEKGFENGHVSSILIPNQPNLLHRERTTTFESINSAQLSEPTTMETFDGTSIRSTSSGRRDSFLMRARSVSTTDKRPSLWSNGTSICRSMTNPAHSAPSSCRPLLRKSPSCEGSCSCGGSCILKKPDRGLCLLREIEAADYVLPSKRISTNSRVTSTAKAQRNPTPPDLSATGYMDVEGHSSTSRGTLRKMSESSTFDPQLLNQQQHPTRKGTEALYESIKYESVKDKPILPPIHSSSEVLNLTQRNPPLSNGETRGNLFNFKKTDPLPPTPTEFVDSKELNQDKVLMVTKSDPNVQNTLKQNLDYGLDGSKRQGNGFHTLPNGAQSLH